MRVASRGGAQSACASRGRGHDRAMSEQVRLRPVSEDDLLVLRTLTRKIRRSRVSSSST